MLQSLFPDLSLAMILSQRLFSSKMVSEVEQEIRVPLSLLNNTWKCY